jgi:glucokinase
MSGSQQASDLATSEYVIDDVVVGLDVGGTAVNATVLNARTGQFLVDTLCETPSRVSEGPPAAMGAIRAALDDVLARVGIDDQRVRSVGLGTPGPSSALGVLSSRGSTNFSQPDWHSFDIRKAAEQTLGKQVVYSNDGNAAALYAHSVYFGQTADRASSISAIVGTGLGGGVIIGGRIVMGASGMAGEFGHVHIPLDGLVGNDQPAPACKCGFIGDAESIASLTGITTNLLPWQLARFPEHPLATADPATAARSLRALAVAGDDLALRIFRQQATALGRLFTILLNVLDPDICFVGGGVMEADAAFRDRFLSDVRANMAPRREQQTRTLVAPVPDLDMAGARGAAMAALQLDVESR